MTKLLWASTIFLTAFLAFQVQPIIARLILPWFGGAAAVWTTCLMFFQTVLVLGYAYAHGLTRWLSPKFQKLVHLGLLAASLVALPIQLRPVESGADPSWQVLAVLALSVGLPYFVLTTTTPLLQAWYPKDLGGDIYRFYALSNAGSLLGVLSYPVLVEPLFNLHFQASLWSGAYFTACASCAAAALLRKKQSTVEPQLEGTPLPSVGVHALWVVLPACSVALLLAITNHLSQNLAAIPLLWIIPLSLYLLSFIFAFSGRKLYPRYFYLRLLAVALAATAYALDPRFGGPSLVLLMPLYCATLFVCCMVCHGELARLKPAPQNLTAFYFAMSLGGTLGGMFVALAAPRLFNGYFELPLALGACAVLALVVLHRDPQSPFYEARWGAPWLIAMGIAIVIVASLAAGVYRLRADSRLMVRNFYGVLRELDEDKADASGGIISRRVLLNGPIQHGVQLTYPPDLRRQPTSYYGPHSGVGLTLSAMGEDRALRVGAIGLGVGTIATYGRPGDVYIFYEINPQVIELARRDFFFLHESEAWDQVLEGDARLRLEQQSPQNFDVLVADAFSGDAIPVHLLTREAFELYFRHLKPDGVLAVHVSNSYLNLEPVVASAAAALGKTSVKIYARGNDAEGTFGSTWILISSHRAFFESPAIRAASVPLAADPQFPLWTDDYSNLVGILKWTLD